MTIGDLENKGETLRKGDILLFYGTDEISKLIQCLDGAHYSHAALYMGNGKIQESTRDRCINGRIEESSFFEYNKVLVKRLKSEKKAIKGMSYVYEKAAEFEKNEYDFVQVAYLAQKGIGKCFPKTTRALNKLKKLLDLLNEQIGKKIVNSDKQLQCAEFVYRCYNDAENAKRDKRYIKLNKGDFYYRNIFNSNEEDTIDRTVRISAIDDLNFEDVEASIKNNINSEPFNEDVQEKIKGYLKLIQEEEDVGEFIPQSLWDELEIKLNKYRVLLGAAEENTIELNNLDFKEDDLRYYFNKILEKSIFVTAKDINYAKNLKNIIKFVPDKSKRSKDWIFSKKFNKHDNP